MDLKKHRSQWLFLAIFFLQTLLLTPASQAQKACENVHTQQAIQLKQADAYSRIEAQKELLKFAQEHNLPVRYLEVGPADRKIQRLFVAVDVANEALMQAYRDRFNLDTPIGDKGAGTLVLEFMRESLSSPEHYVPAIVRTDAKFESRGWRWGKPDPYMTYPEYWNGWMLNVRQSNEYKETGIAAFGHLIELSKSEQENFKIFINNPDLRAPCKSDNCVAWQTGIELGRTAKDATDAERKFLFNELGVSRSMAHFEIGRRLMHAANERHNAIVVFVNGEKGIHTFQTALEKTLVPEPKIPYQSIIRGYQANLGQSLKAVEAIPDGAKIFVPIAAGASPDGIAALIQRATQTKKGFDVHVLVNGISANDFRKGIETTDGKFRVHALFLGSNLRELHAEGKVDVIPGNLSDFTRVMKDPTQTEFHYDAILVRVSPPDANGYHSLGPNQDMIMTILQNRPGIKIIAEVNPNVPYTNGTNRIHKDKITSQFESKTQLAGPAVVPLSEVDSKIGHHIAQLIDSGSYLQIGIGNIFGGVPASLKALGKKDLKISTEMLGDPMMEMIKDGTAKSAETGFAYGSTNLYKWLDRNPKVVFKDTAHVNSPGRVSRLKQFHAVNTALQVNLFGESNATMGPNGRISSPGGQVEFMTGASRSPGGKAIIAIRSTAKEGALSSIVLDFYPGPITTPHESVTHVVTEYGIAVLQGKSIRQRAIALINVAHPKFRAEILAQAIKRGLLKEEDRAHIQD